MKNKIFNIILIFLLVILAIILIFKEKIGDLDELWQYNFANNVTKRLNSI